MRRRQPRSTGALQILSLTTPNPAAGGRLGAAIFEATCKCKFVSAYPYAIGPRLGVAYAFDAKTVFRGGWGLAYAAPPDINIQNTANLTNSAVGVNAFNAINTAGPAFPTHMAQRFDAGQTPRGGQTTSGFLAYLDPGAARPARQNQWSAGIQREITPNTVIEAAYVGNRGVWWSGGSGTTATGPLGYLNQISPQVAAAYGLNPYTNATDNLLLGSPLSSAGGHFPRRESSPFYPGYAASNTLLNALRPFPQFSSILDQNSPTGRTWYDSLQAKGTHRLSHGLQVSGTFHLQSKALVGIRPNLFVASEKSFEPTDEPFVFNANILYTTQRYELLKNRILSLATRDWAASAHFCNMEAACL